VLEVAPMMVLIVTADIVEVGEIIGSIIGNPLIGSTIGKPVVGSIKGALPNGTTMG
jgi:hypothetical protein